MAFGDKVFVFHYVSDISTGCHDMIARAFDSTDEAKPYLSDLAKKDGTRPDQVKEALDDVWIIEGRRLVPKGITVVTEVAVTF